MKKRIISIVLALALVIGMTVPALAASDSKTVAQRISDIEKNYGIIVKYTTDVSSYVPATLDSLESALTYFGSQFTKKCVTAQTKAGYKPFVILLEKNNDPLVRQGIYGRVQWNGKDEHYMRLFPTASSIPPVYAIIHEFGHVFNNALRFIDMNNNVPFMNWDINKMDEIFQREIKNGEMDFSYSPDKYVSHYATADINEDFAETFAVMIINGGSNPTTASKNTKVYEKMLFVRNCLVDYIGAGSRAAKRASEYLGIKTKS